MDFILILIIACEIGFWVLVVMGLAARYLLRRPRVGAALLLMTLVVDATLLGAVIVNLRGGGEASFFHGLAALYLGISIVYGRRMIAWADARFAYRFAAGPVPFKPYGREHTRQCWMDVVRTAAAVGIASVILWMLTTLVDDATSIDELLGVYRILGIWFAVDLIWAVAYTLAPRKQQVSDRLVDTSVRSGGA